MKKSKITIEVEASDALEAARAEKSLQMLADKLSAKGINKLMDMYNNPFKKVIVDNFLKGIK